MRPSKEGLSWRQKGYTVIPNVLIQCPIPQGAKMVYMALSARAFGNKPVVCCASSVLGDDLGVSRQTVQKHLNILEAFHFISRYRRGRKLCNVIRLTLKDKFRSTAKTVTQAISQGLYKLKDAVFTTRKYTVKECLAMYYLHREANKPNERLGFAV